MNTISTHAGSTGTTIEMATNALDILPLPPNPFDELTTSTGGPAIATPTPRRWRMNIGSISWHLFIISQARRAVKKALRTVRKDDGHEDI